MTDKYTLILEGTPKSKLRPRFSTQLIGRRLVPKTYDMQSKDKEKDRMLLYSQMRDKAILRCQISMIAIHFRFRMPKPKSMPKKRLKTFHDKKPDLDNMIKYYLDIMNGIVYDDDKLVVKLSADKIYDENPRVEIDIESIMV
ncbi:MAG: RusA family crossover junction endodeoxyribonuclease [Nitrosopumilaceae archaeon]|nr:RusA family crossover junction endodeoxyribonuclease [Nitrosopumilaceae archaeon]